jgi:hypothetical protein
MNFESSVIRSDLLWPLTANRSRKLGIPLGPSPLALAKKPGGLPLLGATFAATGR